MAYEKHIWETGETITAEKLNNLEDGVASGDGGSSTLVTYWEPSQDRTKIVLDHTWQEIYDAFPNVVIAEKGYDNTGIIVSAKDGMSSEGNYRIYAYMLDQLLMFSTTSRDDYPSHTIES